MSYTTKLSTQGYISNCWPSILQNSHEGLDALSATSANLTLPRFLSLPAYLGPCSAPPQPPLNHFLSFAPLNHCPKFHPSAMHGSDCPLHHQQKILTCEPTAYTVVQRFLMSLRKPNGPVWYSGLSDFSCLGPLLSCC
jgi:hypothetical protein